MDSISTRKFGGSHNMEEFLHGYCDLYLAYFLSRNPEWTGRCIIRRESGRIIHAYAVRKQDPSDPSSMCMYGDARGIFTDREFFFRPYKFSMKGSEFRDMTEEELERCMERMDEKGLREAIEELYNCIY